VIGEELTTLSERHGVRVYPVDAVELAAWQSDETMPDAKAKFAFNFYVVLPKKVIVFDDGARETVFDGNDDGVYFFSLQHVEGFGGECAWIDGCLRSETECCFVAE
jgi:hypothetical protein